MATENKAAQEQEKNAFRRGVDQVIDLLSSVFLPFIALMVSAGILKGIFILLTINNVVPADSSTYHILNAMSDAFFYFIPVFLAYTAAKRFGVEPFTSILIACIILHPDISSIMQSGAPLDFFGVPVTPVVYSASVIPILLTIYCMKFIQQACYKIIPETFKGLFTPPICVLIIVPLTLLVFGPLGKIVGGWLADGYEFIYGLSPLLAGAFIGAFQPFMVIFGLHWGLFPIALNNVAVYGYDTIMALFGGAIFGQGGAALAVAFKTNNKRFRSEAISASLTTLLGITEPAMFGVNLRLRTPMFCACVAGGIGSAIAGHFGSRAISFALPALTTLPVFMTHAFIPFVLSLAVAFVLAFVFTLFVKFEDVTDEDLDAAAAEGAKE
ncbi:MAG: PTS transporter subunit EIIC [Veillonella sp.]|uniref:PTS transporter subunit EIIC n=1 Tax=Veillonella sp. TaxID=1926307 RepID=UPI0025E21E2F|nr:PTS transporter subunit EIIC [Veillonella sp.]MBS4913098.1 PTS transporter subunit EIIC [Veillonella sp.]